MNITQASLIFAGCLVSFSVFSNQWVAVDCRGQAREFINQLDADSELQLAEDQLERIAAISVAVCEGKGTIDGTEGAATKKKGFFDSLSFGEEGEKKKKKKGNERFR